MTPWKQGRKRPSANSHSRRGTAGQDSRAVTGASAATVTDVPSAWPAGTDRASPSGSEPPDTERSPRNANGAPLATRMATDAGPGAHGSASVRVSSTVSGNGAPGFPCSCRDCSRPRPRNSPSGSARKALPSSDSASSRARPLKASLGSVSSALFDRCRRSRPARPRNAPAGSMVSRLPERLSSVSWPCAPRIRGSVAMRLLSSRSDESNGSVPNTSAGQAESRLPDRSKSRSWSSSSKSSARSCAIPARGRRSAVCRDRSATAAQGRLRRRASRTAGARSHTPSSIVATACGFTPRP